jgi:hypothetical protein
MWGRSDQAPLQEREVEVQLHTYLTFKENGQLYSAAS